VREIEKTLASLCTVLFVITAIIVLVLFNIERKAFVSETYKLAFETRQLYERMPSVLAATVQQTISQNPSAYPFLKELTAEDWQATIVSILPAEDLRAVTNSALDSTFEYINGRSNSAVITLVPIKTRLVGDTGVNIVVQFLGTQPACTAEQLQQMALGLFSGNIVLCNPPPQAISLVRPLIQSQLQTVTAAIPDVVTIVPQTNNDPRPRLHMVRSAIRFSPFFVFLLLLAVAIFGARSLRDLFIWWGWPLTITGVTGTLIALIGSPLIAWLLQFLIETQGTFFLPPLLASTIAEAAGAVANQILSPMIIQGLLISFLGLLLLVLAAVLRPQVLLDTP
jgi:hypothetical protein